MTGGGENQLLIVELHDELIPIRITFFDEVYFPLAGPAFHGFLFGYGIDDEVKAFEPDEARHIICLLYTSPSPRD